MASGEGGGGFQEAAGLVRYFDEEEESAIHLDPRLVLGICFMTAIVTILFNWQCTPGAGPCF